MAPGETNQLEGRNRRGSETTTDLSVDAVEEISSNLRRMLAVFVAADSAQLTTFDK